SDPPAATPTATPVIAPTVASAAPTLVVVVGVPVSTVPASVSPTTTSAAATPQVFFIEEHTTATPEAMPAAPTNPLTTVVVVFVPVPVATSVLFGGPIRSQAVVTDTETPTPAPGHDPNAGVVLTPTRDTPAPRTDSIPIRGSDDPVDGGPA